MSKLEKITVGEYYFPTALLLRESIFLNGILTNAETWYGVTKAELKPLEDLDILLLRQILNTQISVPTESLYLELGCQDIQTILKARRINYLHYLLTSNPDSMLTKFFNVQLKYPSPGDWTEQVKVDLADFGIEMDLDTIRSKSIYSFKNIVKRKPQYMLCTLVLKRKKFIPN